MLLSSFQNQLPVQLQNRFWWWLEQPRQVLSGLSSHWYLRGLQLWCWSWSLSLHRCPRGLQLRLGPWDLSSHQCPCGLQLWCRLWGLSSHWCLRGLQLQCWLFVPFWEVRRRIILSLLCPPIPDLCWATVNSSF